MSQDLLAAFGEAPAAATLQQPGSNAQGKPYNNHPLVEPGDEFDGENRMPMGLTIREAGQEETDDFGDFVDASASSLTDSPNHRHHTNLRPSKEPANFRTKQANNSLRDGQKSVAGSKPPQSNQAATKEQPGTRRHPFADHMDILFDAGDDEYDAGADELTDLSTNPEAAMAYSKRLIAEQEAAFSRQTHPGASQGDGESTTGSYLRPKAGESLYSKNPKPLNSNGQTKPKNVDVLLDIDDVNTAVNSDSGDDWGDFEGSLAKANNSVSTSLTDPLTEVGQAEAMSSNGSRTEAGALPAKTNMDQNNISDSVTVAKNDGWSQGDDGWDDFETSVPIIATSGVTGTPDWASAAPTESSPSEQQLAPTNVPPPVILLSLFPALFTSANEALFESLSRMSSSQKQALLAHPASYQFLKGYLDKCTVLAYLLAGRKLRWKRDQRLAQSMRIGPAAAGGKGGMKLVGLDKAESAREDREAVDIIRLYRAQMGKFQTAVTTANNGLTNRPAKKKLGRVPNINESVLVKTLTPLDGGLTATRPCALCGLKRNERVTNTDHDVEDSFGEWWAPRLNMHVVCHEFWEHEARKLSGR